MSKWEYGEDLIKQYHEEYVLDILRGGLQPHSSFNGKEIYCPYRYHEYSYWNKFLESHPGFPKFREQKEQFKKYRPIPLIKNIPPNDFNKKDAIIRILKRTEERTKALTRIGEISNEEPNLHEYESYQPDQFEKLSWKFVWPPEEGTKEREELYSMLKKIKFKKDEYLSLINGNLSKRKRGKAPYTRLIEKTITGLIKLHNYTPSPKTVIFSIRNKEFDPEGVFQDYDKSKKVFYFHNPETKKEYDVKLKSLQNRISEILSQYK